MLTQDLVLELMTYDPLTGIVIWNHRDSKYFVNERMAKIWNTRYSGESAGALRPEGYWITSIFNKSYRLHKLIWLYQTGHYPTRWEIIDHVDHNPGNNVWANLRLVTPSESQKNHPRRHDNKSGHTGVFISKGIKENTYRVVVSSTYKTLEEATQVRDQIRTVLGGFHNNHGH